MSPAWLRRVPLAPGAFVAGSVAVWALAAILILAPAPSRAQYLYLDANGDGVHTTGDVLSSSTTSVDVWLSTNRNRDGSTATCQQSSMPLSLIAYEFILRASGPITWGTWTDALGMPVSLGLGRGITDYFTGRSFGAGVRLPPGLYRLGRLTLSGIGPTTGLTLVDSTPLNAQALTGFGTDCEGILYDNTYKLPGDWQDVDGVPHETAGPCTEPVPGDAFPDITAPATASAVVGTPIQIQATATDPDAGNTLTVTVSGKPAWMTFASTPGVSPVQATLSGTPDVADVGDHSIVWAVDDGQCATDIATTVVSVADVVVDHPPVVEAASEYTVNEGALLTFTVGASDPDGDPITSLEAAPLPAGSGFSANPANTVGTFSWTPDYSQAGDYTIVFTASNACAPTCATGTATTTIHVLNVNRGPKAVPGGPYAGIFLVPLAMDGSGSSDPDGDPLTYAWDFGDGTTGTGAQPVHTYAANGVYTVTLTVSDGTLMDTASTTATITGFLPATTFTTSPNKAIRLGADRPTWCVEIEPVDESYDNTDVDYSSLTLSYGGGQVAAVPSKSHVSSDKNRNNIDELTACFTKEDLRVLFGDLPGGASDVDVVLSANLLTGGTLQARMTIRVTSMGNSLAARLSPNPMNPEATLTFVTRHAGWARIALFDTQGRWIRTLLDEPSLGAGYHDVRIAGAGGSSAGAASGGARLVSGVYFYRIETAEGTAVGRVVVAK